jgi:hypothetical protein
MLAAAFSAIHDRCSEKYDFPRLIEKSTSFPGKKGWSLRFISEGSS